MKFHLPWSKNDVLTWTAFAFYALCLISLALFSCSLPFVGASLVLSGESIQPFSETVALIAIAALATAAVSFGLAILCATWSEDHSAC